MGAGKPVRPCLAVARSLTLIEAIFLAPLAAVNVADGDLIHAVTADGFLNVDWGTALSATAVCGADVKLTGTPWPVPRNLAGGRTRCPVCRDTAGDRMSAFHRRWWGR